MKSLIEIVGVFSSITTFTVLVTLCMSKILTLKNVLRLAAIYSGISFANDLMLAMLPSYFHYHFLFSFTLLEYGCFAWMFYMILGKPLSKNVVLVGSFMFLVIVSIGLRSYGSSHFDAVNTGSEAILIIIYSIFYFMEKLNSEKMEPIFDSPGSYVVLACLFYLAGNLFLFITSESQNATMWVINSLCNLTRNVFFIVAIRQCTKPIKRQITPITGFTGFVSR
ncbi:MAG: hypothetical protein EOO02_07845 [Chitinophagaceae bacterium]|nr:MAG: hypothetical protein EOO02_07845 [Chitinophagaceae bacterium]